MASAASKSSRSHDSGSDSGAGARSSPVAAGEAVAVIQRDEFLLELGEALGGQISIRPVETLAAALEQLGESRRPRILLIDSRDTTELRADVERAHSQAPQVPIIVFAPADAEKSVAGALKSSNVFAVLPIPVDHRKTAAIIEGAIADAAARRGASRAPERPVDLRASFRASVGTDPASSPMRGGPADSEERPRKKILLVAVAAVAVAAAAGGYYAMRPAAVSNRPQRAVSAPHASASVAASAHASSAARPIAASPAAPAPAATPSPVEPSLVQGAVDSLLERARLAMRERRFMAPSNDSALLYYRSALQADPRSGEAKDGLARLAGLAKSRFDAAIGAGRYDAAATALADLKLAAPNDARLGSLEAQLLQGEIANAFATGDFTRAAAFLAQAQQSHAASGQQLAAWRAELARGESTARAGHLASLVEQSIASGNLRSPAGASAQGYLGELEALAPASPAAKRAARALIAAYLSKARESALAGDSSAAASWIAAARAAGMTDAQLATYQRSVAEGRAKAAAQQDERLAALARSRIQSGALIAPDHDSADYYLTELARAQGASDEVHSIGIELSTSLIAQATAAARAGKIDAMRADLAAARRWGADPVLVSAVEQIVSGPSKASPGDAGATPRIPSGYTPRRIRYVAPEYPETALETRQSGTVTVEFTVDYDGVPRKVRVVASHPRGVFDYAAVTAVAQWRFAPPVIDNVPMQIPTRTVIRFVAPK